MVFGENLLLIVFVGRIWKDEDFSEWWLKWKSLGLVIWFFWGLKYDEEIVLWEERVEEE